jgi:guanylate kinase
MKGILFIITSPSGGGKGTLIKEILRTVENISYSVSFTTRKRREGEIHGKDYFFVSPGEFENLVQQGDFLEYAKVHGNFYGTLHRQVKRETESGRDIILEIDVQGAENVKAKMPEAVSVFILPPSFEVLRQRLLARQTESEEDLQLRLKNAKTEVKFYKQFDYVIINEEKNKAVENLKSVITAERLRSVRQTDDVESIINSFKNSFGDY